MRSLSWTAIDDIDDKDDDKEEPRASAGLRYP
jgi:hypothetical protein